MPFDLSTFSFKSEFWTLTFPLFLMTMDFFTGFINAWRKKEVKSSIMREGLAKKAGECTVILICLMLTKATNIPIGILVFFVAYISVMEIISISENLDKLGVPLPKWLKKGLGTLKTILDNNNPLKGDDKSGTEHADSDDSGGGS